MTEQRRASSDGATTDETKLLWLLEDDPVSRDLVVEVLHGRWTVRTFGTLRAFEDAASAPDRANIGLVIADVCLPDGNFVSWLASERARNLLAGVPFLVLSSIDDPEVVRRAFGGGALDFLSKPFGPAELAVKVERFISGRPAIDAAPLPFELDATAMVVRGEGGVAVELTAKEMQILTLIRSAPSQTLAREELHAKVWNGSHVGRKTLDVHLSRLRRKLAELQLDVRSVPPNRVALVVVRPG